MKNVIKLYAFLLAVVLIQSCGSDDSSDLIESQLTINFPEDYLPGSQIGHAYLTDESGTLISDSPIQNGLSVVLSANFDAPDKRFDLTILRELTYLDGFNSKALTTYINVKPAEIDLKLIQATQFNGEATVTIQNTGTAIDDICCFSGNGTISANEAELRISLREGNDIYLVLQNENESFKRYYLERGVANNYSTTLDYTDLSILDEPFGITIPASDRFLSKIEGNFIDNPNQEEFILSSLSNNAPEGEEIANHYIPENTFNISKVENNVTIGSATYRIVESTNTIPQAVLLPDFDLNITNTEIGTFTGTASGSFDYYTLGFSFINDFFYITWGVVGESDDLPNAFIPTAVGEVVHNQFSDFRIEKLGLFAGQVTNYSGEPTLEEILEGKDHDRIESVSKTY